MKTNKYTSSAMLLLTAFFWGFAFVAQDMVTSISPMTVGFMRWFIGSAFLLIPIAIFDKINKSERRLFRGKMLGFNRDELLGGLICGVVLTVASVFQQAGINAGTSGGKAAFITALYVVLVPIYAVFLRKKVALNVWVAVFVALVGFYLLCVKENEGIVASDLLVIASSVIYPVHILVIDHFSPKCDGMRMSCIQFFVAFVINFVGALIFEAPIQYAAIGSNILPFLYMGIFSSGIAYTLQIIGQRNVAPAVASIILSLESVFGLVGSVIILGTKLEAKEYIGAILIFFAVIFSQLELGKRAKN